jgi:hypothetical protein
MRIPNAPSWGVVVLCSGLIVLVKSAFMQDSAEAVYGSLLLSIGIMWVFVIKPKRRWL